MSLSECEPLTDFRGLQKSGNLPIGSTGIVGVTGFGVPHSIGYGMESEGLQVMSSHGELGFAANETILDFYSQLYPDYEVGLYEMPTQQAAS